MLVLEGQCIAGGAVGEEQRVLVPQDLWLWDWVASQPLAGEGGWGRGLSGAFSVCLLVVWKVMQPQLECMGGKQASKQYEKHKQKPGKCSRSLDS